MVGADIKRVLVIDPLTGVYGSVGKLLPEATIDGVDCCIEGIEKIKDTKYDIVLLDIRLVKESGMDCLIQLREAYKDLPIVIVTAGSDEFKTVCLDNGADDYVNKEVMSQTLHAVIVSAIKRRIAKNEIDAELQHRLSQLDDIKSKCSTKDEQDKG